MKTEKTILIAFLLNLVFSIFELFGGAFTNSIAILTDAIHDFGDSLSIGISYFLEKKSKKRPNDKYTYGYLRYSILGAFITNVILMTGSILVLYNSVKRLINPVSVNYDGMIVLALLGVGVNFCAAYFTRDGKSLNQKAVNLHMLEDVLGWVIVLVGAIVIKFTKIIVIDAILSIFVALFIVFHVIKSMKSILDIFLLKMPITVNLEDLKKHLLGIEGIIDVHHFHIWSLDGVNNYATMHVIYSSSVSSHIKEKIKIEMKEYGICHTTVELEEEGNICDEYECTVKVESHHHH